MTMASQMRLKLNNHGFTLIELLIVVAVIGILSTIAIPLYQDVKVRAVVARAQTDISGLSQQIALWVADKGPGNYPDKIEDLPEAVIYDPWGTKYEYFLISKDPTKAYMNASGIVPLNTEYDLYSKGVDGASNASLDDPTCMDDIIRGFDGSTIELGEKFPL